jgi:hypothetical protein
MAPRTRKSHPKATADRTYVKENENQLPLQTSNIANTKRSKVPARRVIPENQSLNPQQGKSRNYIESDTTDSMLSGRETYLHPNSSPKRCPFPHLPALRSSS